MAFDPDLRGATVAAFLREHGWGEAHRAPLGQDASTRRYERLTHPDGRTAMLMDAPPVEDAPCPPGADEATRNAMGWNAQARLAASRVEAFAALAGELSRAGLSAPEIYGADPGQGLALIEDFGELREFARLIERGEDEVMLYTAAAETLAHVHALALPELAEGYGVRWPIQPMDGLVLRTQTDPFAEWLPHYVPGMVLDDRMRARWTDARADLIALAETFPRALTLRDYHAENLLWLPDRDGIARVGLLDFQDAVAGWDGWDLTMLVHDARRPVSPAAREAAVSRYCAETGKDRKALDERLAVIGALNAMRITGLFARLVIRDGKPRYRNFMDRQLEMLAMTLDHPSTADMGTIIGEAAPSLLEPYRS